MNYDKIEKHVLLKAPVERVWQAITDPQEFGEWFGVKLEGEFAEGQTVTGTFDASLNENVVKTQQKQLGLQPSAVRIPQSNKVFCTIERIEPEQYFSFRWIPYGIDAEVDPETESTTLVEFRLEATVGGTQLTITESGFEQVPAHRRERAFLMNNDGWTQQAERVKRYVEHN